MLIEKLFKRSGRAGKLDARSAGTLVTPTAPSILARHFMYLTSLQQAASSIP